MKKNKGIYCLEIGEWYGSMKQRNSVEPILSLLHQSPLQVPYIHRDIATVPELEYYIRKWTQKSQKEYPILYLAFHGSPGSIYLFKENGKPIKFTADELFEHLKGKCHKRVIHFGACSVLDIHGNKVNRYLKESGAIAISGYKTDIDWVLSGVFEMLYLSKLQYNQFTRAGIRAVKTKISKEAAQLKKTMAFQIRIK